MSAVPAFHTETDSPEYNPRERYIYHNQSDCGYGREVKQDNNGINGMGKDPDGKPRLLCDRCTQLAAMAAA